MSREVSRGGTRRRWAAAGAVVAGAAAFAVFYGKYVPLVPGFQAFLAPVLAVVFLFTLSGIGRGLGALVFALPLVNSLPYFFGITDRIPHAPTALPLLLTFALGWAARTALFPSGPDGEEGGGREKTPGPGRPCSIERPMAILSALIAVSAVVTAFRYAGFFPFAADEVRELVVNAAGVRAGGAIMSVVFSGLCYLLGFLVFAAVRRAPGGRAFEENLLRLLAAAVFAALVFAAYQVWRDPGLGNLPIWIRKGQINGTFKDPNSLAGFLAAFIPVALGLALSARGWIRKIAPLVAAGLGLAVLPHAGSRSSLVGLAVGLAVFGAGFAVSRMTRKTDRAGRRRIRTAVIIAVTAVAVVSVVLLLGLFGSTLAERMQWSVDLLRGDLEMDEFFNMRLTLWAAAVRMTAAYPLSGVGVGAYIVELPNVMAGWDRFGEGTDSALNYVLQTGAELGLPGIVFFVWIFAGLAGRMVRAVRGRPVDFAALGAASGLAAFFIVFVFHTYIGSFEVIAFFWLLAGLLFRRTERGMTGDGDAAETGSGAGRANSGDRPGDRKRGAAALGLVAAGLGVFGFGAVHLRNSLGSLSFERQADKYGWIQDFGFYPRERDDRGFNFRWSGKRVGLALPDVGVPVVLPVTAMHPDIAEIPVRIRIHRADGKFRPRELLLEHVQSDKEWTEIEIAPGGGGAMQAGSESGMRASVDGMEDGGGVITAQAEGEAPDPSGDGNAGPDWEELAKDVGNRRIWLLIEVDRTWNPMRDLGVADPRELGFALGEPWYRHHRTPPDKAVTERSETYSVENWEGPWGQYLWNNASARLKFRFEPLEGKAQRAALVLHLKGEEADGVRPFAVIRLDGRIVGRTFVQSQGWTPFVLYPGMAPGERILSVEYTNEFINPLTRADRNLYLGPLRLLYLKQNK